MTAEEAIAAVRRGERVKSEFSLHDTEKSELCPDWNHQWRTLFCDGGDLDVVECRHCGRQEVAHCNFDEEYS